MENIKNLLSEIAVIAKETSEYKSMEDAKAKYDADDVLQTMLVAFNNLRDQMYKERDSEKIDKNKVIKLQQDMQALYSQIMDNKAMQEYTQRKNDFDDYMEKIHNLLNAEIFGAESGCTGSCATCTGCH